MSGFDGFEGQRACVRAQGPIAACYASTPSHSDFSLQKKIMATKKGQGSSRNGRDSNSQRLGVKAHDGNLVPGGTIIVRQRGRRFRPGLNVGRGKDDTLFAKVTGILKFSDHGAHGRVISVEPVDVNK